MSNKKYASVDVFDLSFYNIDDASHLFTVSSAKKVTISKKENREAILHVTDALIDIKLLKDVLNGNLKEMNMYGETIWRDIDSEEESSVELIGERIELWSYNLNTLSGNVASVDMIFVMHYKPLKVKIRGEE